MTLLQKLAFRDNGFSPEPNGPDKPSKQLNQGTPEASDEATLTMINNFNKINHLVKLG